LSNYVTTVNNPDDVTLRRYPFKASSVVVMPRGGEIGWYDCKVSVLPHVQFEGLDVELMLEARLG
jgi:type VI secretion system protein ImpC